MRPNHTNQACNHLSRKTVPLSEVAQNLRSPNHFTTCVTQCNTDSSSYRILMLFHCDKEQHSTAVHGCVCHWLKEQQLFQRANGGKTQGLFSKSCSCRGWVHGVGYHGSWPSVTWWSFTFLTSKHSILLTSWVKWGFHQTCFVKGSPDGLALCLPDLYCSLLVTQGSGSQSGGHGLLGAIKNWREDYVKKKCEKNK